MENTNIGNEQLNRIKIGLPKGDLFKYSSQIICALMGNCIKPKKLSYQNCKYEIYLTKLRDIPHLLENNILDVGITCDEWIVETGADVEIVKRLDWCDTKISLIGCEAIDSIKYITCITEYPNIAKKYFESKQIKHKIYKISGSSEAFVPHRFDYCVDCVETQSTLNANDLREIDILLSSKIVLAKAPSFELRIDELLERIEHIAL